MIGSQVRMKFYYQCDANFESDSVRPELAAQFFKVSSIVQ